MVVVLQAISTNRLAHIFCRKRDTISIVVICTHVIRHGLDKAPSFERECLVGVGERRIWPLCVRVWLRPCFTGASLGTFHGSVRVGSTLRNGLVHGLSHQTTITVCR